MNIICNPISGIPKSAKSHTRGWSDHWAELLNAKVVNKVSDGIEADTVYVDNGVNFGGTVNMFGGFNDEVYHNVNTLAQAENVVSLDTYLPNYGEIAAKRMGAKTTSAMVTDEWCERMSQRFSDIPVVTMESLKCEHYVIGDSHSTAFANHGDGVLRQNGRTLHGVVRGDGLKSLLPESMPVVRGLTFCLGSIDIRHHALRYDWAQMENLVWQYAEQAKAISKEYGIPVHVCKAVPVEHEGRKLPKTGYYDGTPFYGKREDRLEMTLWFNKLLHTAMDGKVVSPPMYWYDMEGERYAKEIMELGGSVHIAPENYRKYNWGYEYV